VRTIWSVEAAVVAVAILANSLVIAPARQRYEGARTTCSTKDRWSR
jgi:hypothetical protein